MDDMQAVTMRKLFTRRSSNQDGLCPNLQDM